MGLINKLYKKLKEDPALKTKDEDNKKQIKSIKTKIMNRNKKSNLDRSKLENYLLKQDLTPQDLNKSNSNPKKNEVMNGKKLDSLLNSDNYTYIKDFVDRWGDDNCTNQSLKILHKKLDEKGFKIDKKDLKPILIEIRKLEKKKNDNKIKMEIKLNSQKNLVSLIKSDFHRFVEDFVNNFGEDSYPDVLFKRLQKRLENKGYMIDEDDLRRHLTLVRKLRNEKRERYTKSTLTYEGIAAIHYMERMNDYSGSENITWLKKLLLEDKGLDEINADLVINKYVEKQYNDFEKKQNNEIKNELNDHSYSSNKIDSLNGFEFENFLSILFQEMGYQVQSTKLSGDQGADLIISKYNEKIAVQAKRYKNKVSNSAVQEVVASIAHYGANKGMVVTNSHFTKSAIELAKSNQIQLIDGDELNSLINKHLK